ncbi:MAG: hypothetical protein BM562_05065 [Alphaproteobacteria bacterium MedPE-SWcel]|nr:MAG: hypothetical protein BM562_05065 [Alphaproteobacteria bacterium MedPE-SWcel]
MKTMPAEKSAQNSVNEMLSDSGVSKSWFLDGSNTSTPGLQVDVSSVWDDYRGEGVLVGVLDSQIDYHHAELESAYDLDLDYNFDFGTGDFNVNSKSISDWHGTMVAGVIAAEGGNETGTVGIAPEATLVGLGINYSSSDVLDQIQDGLTAAAELDVVNCSWSFTQNFADNFNLSAYSHLGDTLQFVAETGRDGLGTSMVFSAGNGGATDTSNYHNFQNSPYTIAVGAFSQDGSAWDNSSIGANVLVSAAGDDIFTTRPKGGLTTTDGTSFSAPAVSAVIALMYEANEDLGYRDVQQILAFSAERQHLGDSAPYGLGWQTNSADTFNGGGMHYSDTFGYGAVNAHNAVRLAESWTQQQTAQNRDTVSVAQNVGAQLVAGTTDHVSIDIQVDQDILVEHVQLTMGLTWRYTGDLDIYLTSAEGQQVQLVYENEDSSRIGNLRDFTFASVASMGELGAGTWTLDIYNLNLEAEEQGAAMTGNLINVNLEIHGETDGLEDNTYVYTDEFGVLYDGDDLEARSQLSDTDGGHDTINAAAVSSDSYIDLSGASLSNIANTALEILTPGAIESAYAGDGDDVLIGNAADNLLSGGRGDDHFELSTGNDTIEGGAGTDTLLIGGALASITATLTDAGSFVLGYLGGSFSTVFGVEFFAFTDGSYSWDNMVALVADGTVSPVNPLPPEDEETDPVDVPPTVEDPDGDDPVGEDPTEDPDIGDPISVPPGNPGDDPLATETGDSGDNLLEGGRDNDVMMGLGGNDTIFGNKGDDTLDGGTGDDQLRGGANDDLLLGGDGRDRLFGQAGNDTLEGGDGRDVLKGGGNDDVLIGGAGRDQLFGGAGADSFVLSVDHLEDYDLVRDFSQSDGDRIIVQGSDLYDADDLIFRQSGADTYLGLATGSGVVDIARIEDTAVGDLSLSHADNGDLILI